MALGLVVGAAGVVVISRTLRGLLYGVTAFDPVALVFAVGVLFACATIALLIPVLRAARVDPIRVMR